MKGIDGTVVRSCIALFFLCILGSYFLNHWKLEWWPEFLLILAEAALSVVIVLKIIDETNRRDKERRWESVKLLIFSQIEVKLKTMVIDVGFSNLMQKLNPAIIQDITKIITNKDVSKDELAPKLADCIRRNIRLNSKNIEKNIFYSKDINKDILDILAIIVREIDEYQMALVPRIMDISDEEVSFALLEFESYYVIFLNLTESLKQTEDSPVWWIFAQDALRKLANFLYKTAYLRELIQQKTKPEQKLSLMEKNLEKLKLWWWPYEYQ